MKKILVYSLTFLLYGGLWGYAHAQSVTQPEFHLFSFEDNSEINNMSDNGRWAVADAKSPENDTHRAYPKLIDLSDNSVTKLDQDGSTSSSNWYGVSDVTDDGSMVVGSIGGSPALWRRSLDRWVVLPLPGEWSGGSVHAITPDGRLAVGVMGGADGAYTEAPALWNIEKGGVLETPTNLPQKGMTGTNWNQNRFIDISADGRYILGCEAFSYLQPADIFYYVYDLTTQDWKPLGFDLDKDTWTWKPQIDGLYFIDDAIMDCSGKYITGIAYIVSEDSEYRLPFIYETSTGKFSTYDESQMRDYGGFAIDDSGMVLASGPVGNPAREWYVRQDGYWYSFGQILSQRYGIDYKTTTGFNMTGTPMAVSTDGRKVAVLADAILHKSYVVEMPESFANATAGVNLLDNYTAEPASGSTFSRISTVKLTFDRSVQVLGSTSDITFKGDKGTSLTPVKFSTSAGSDRSVEVSFRTSRMQDGETCTLTIPAGTIALSESKDKVNSDIEIIYYGRKDSPVEVISVSPKSGSGVNQINYSTNPVVFSFDCAVVLTDTASATLYIEGRDEPLCDMSMAVSGSKVAVYPATGQYLYKGSNYRLVFHAGAVTDVTGANGNEEKEILYEGTYEREIAENDTLVYSNDFNAGVGEMLLYDNDKLEPSTEMTTFGFETERTPWMPAWDEDNTNNLCAASNSDYKTGGQADDWMATPQLFIPDGKCYLRFKGQSYRANKTDRLKIVVLVADDVLNALDAETVARFKSEGKVVYDAQETPGESEDLLSDGWTEHVVDLAEYAGKNIYIAFWNNNTAQSLLFVDDVEVVHDMKVLASLDTETSVVGLNEIAVKGRVAVKSDLDVFDKVTVTLKDADGNILDETGGEGLGLKKGDVYEFAFDKLLPLQVGFINTYYVTVDADGNVTEVKGEVKDLAFKPVKRVVIEEYTGMGCGNCPLGLLALDRLEKTFGNLILPVAIHTYSGDPYAGDLSSYTTFLLGSNPGAPSASINRLGEAYSPMASVQTDNGIDYVFTAPEGTKMLWNDVVNQELARDADADIEVTADYKSATGTLEIPCKVKYALNRDDLNLNLFAVVVEDNMVGYQTNYFANTSSASLGEWGQGGQYGVAQVVPYYFNDVARACIGMTFNGTPADFPDVLEAGKSYETTMTLPSFTSFGNINNCKVVVMLIDANTGAYINAARAKFTVDGVDGVTDASADDVDVTVCQGGVVVKAPEGTVAEVLGISGTVIGRAECQASTTMISTGSYKGVVVVRVSGQGIHTVKKVLIN